MEILRAENIFKSYEDGNSRLHVLKGLNLVVEKGQTNIVTGESGCGKSTLLHILGSLDSPDSGRVLYEGELVRDMNSLRNEFLGFVFQSHYLLQEFTVWENVAMPMFIKTKNMTKSKKEALEILKVLGLLDKADALPSKLSGGQAQRVAVGRAIVNRPKLILADEPSGSLDHKNKDNLIRIFLELNKRFEQAFVIVTHNLELTDKMNKHYILDDGVLNLQ